MKVFFIIIFMVVSYKVNAGRTQMHQGTASITCKIQGEKNDTVQYSVSSDAAAEGMGVLQPIESIALPDSNGIFTIRIENLNNKKWWRILLLLRSRGLLLPITQNYCIIEAGDNIRMEIKRSAGDQMSIQWTGRGAQKFECQAKIDSIFSQSYIWEVWNSDKYNLWTIENFQKSWKEAQSFPAYAMLRSYKTKLNPQLYHALRVDIEGRLLSNLDLVTTKVNFVSSLEQRKKEIIVFRDLLHVKTIRPPDKDLLNSPMYFNYLMASTATELYWQKDPKEVSAIDLYKRVKRQYIGPLREYLLVGMLKVANRFSKNWSDEKADSIWGDALRIVKTPILREYLKNRFDRKTRGKPAYDFALEDINGKTVRLKDFRGKTVLIDTWFTGCGSCLSYSDQLEKYVYPLFGNDTSLVFISISGDKNKMEWQESVKSGKYTRAGNINLYTGGKGFDHPFTRYYNFDGGPYTMVIDKDGNIYSGNAPTTDMKLLVQLLTEALNK